MMTASLYVAVVEGYFRGMRDREFFIRGIRYEGRDAVLGGRIVLVIGGILAIVTILI
jgi:hypothetical protein